MSLKGAALTLTAMMKADLKSLNKTNEFLYVTKINNNAHQILLKPRYTLGPASCYRAKYDDEYNEQYC